ncbi:hypothetical protein DJ70_07035 [Halorubrum halodurans]|uniref:Archaeal Type IV pilin N-terminal domain-containing protein n=2 Tax=Halorubrum halodurans TaxID=1383851 RepID=A0A256IKA7_9EURY|nr:hypothetical protein DJ70_07035 [Halorubrum halodurans]
MAKVKQMLTGEDAVSPVIGVILMVAVTVVLAAVIAGFVFGLGDNLSQSAPNAQINFDYNANDGSLAVTHDGGDAITADNTAELNWAGPASGNVAFAASESYIDSNGAVSGTIQAGDQIGSDDGGFPSDGEVDLVWVSGEGGTSATLGEFAGPDA